MIVFGGLSFDEKIKIWYIKNSGYKLQIAIKASRKSDTDEIAFIQNHPYGQKMIIKC